MRLLLASVSPRGARAKSAAADALTAEYLGRTGSWLKAAAQVFASEDALLTNVARPRNRAELHWSCSTAGANR